MRCLANFVFVRSSGIPVTFEDLAHLKDRLDLDDKAIQKMVDYANRS